MAPCNLAVMKTKVNRKVMQNNFMDNPRLRICDYFNQALRTKYGAGAVAPSCGMFNSRRRESASSSESRRGRILSIGGTPVLNCLKGVVARVLWEAGLPKPHSQARLPEAHHQFIIRQTPVMLEER